MRDLRCRLATTALAPNLVVLMVGWSFLEGVGAALIMPAIVSLVASNFPLRRGRAPMDSLPRPVRSLWPAGPLIGGAVTTYWSWRLVFVGEVVLVAGILVLTRRIKDVPPEGRFELDYVGILLSSSGLGAAVYGVLKSGEWGWVQPKAGAPSWLGLSPTIWFILGGVVVVRIFFGWERRMMASGREPW